jgi:hypothetical protein
LDARVISAGYLPNYAYAVGATDTSMPFEKPRELSRIHDKAPAADADPDFGLLNLILADDGKRRP